MLVEVASRILTLPDHNTWSFASSLAAVILLCLVTLQYAVSVYRFSTHASASGVNKKPPTVPHAIPFIGNVPWQLLWDPLSFIISSKKLFWNPHPVRAKVLGQDCYIVQGSENASPFLKQHALSGFLTHGIFLQRIFSLPTDAARRYAEDDSGEYATPDPDSSVEPRNRMNYLKRKSLGNLLQGPGFSLVTRKLEDNLTERLLSIQVDNEWTRCDSFMEIFETQVSSAMIDSVCGPALLRRNPEFPKDLWALDHDVMKLICRMPRFLLSKTWASQQRGLAAIKSWYIWAQENFDPESVGPDGYDQYWGSRYFRDLLGMFAAVDGFDVNAIASEVFAFLWASNSNAIVAAFWACLEVFRDKELLNHVRREAESCIIHQTQSDIRFDISRLLRQPVMQAVFTETLRLRAHGFVVRSASKKDIIINDWKIPRNKFIMMSSTPGHMSASVWCNGASESHPVEEFWPGRFLHYSESTKALEFSMNKTKGAWMPFGGGHHPCPGRHISKVEILLAMALLTTTYDCEILASERDLEMSCRNFGLGVLGPANKVPVRMRRRVRCEL